MLIEIHGFNMTIHGMNKSDVKTLCDSLLGLKFEAFTTIKEYNADKYWFTRRTCGSFLARVGPQVCDIRRFLRLQDS